MKWIRSLVTRKLSRHNGDDDGELFSSYEDTTIEAAVMIALQVKHCTI
jgi:hypothetical protein